MNREEFKELYDHHYNKLYIFSCSIIRDSEMAKDIVHDVFIKAWVKGDEIKLDSGYLWKAVHNEACEYLRKCRHRRYVDTSQEKYDQPDENNILSYMIESQILSEVFAKINTLPKRQQQVLSYFLNGFSTKEIASFLKISTQNVLASKGYAINKIKQLMHV